MRKVVGRELCTAQRGQFNLGGNTDLTPDHISYKLAEPRVPAHPAIDADRWSDQSH